MPSFSERLQWKTFTTIVRKIIWSASLWHKISQTRSIYITKMNLLLNQQKNITLLAKYIRYWNLERTLLKKLQKINKLFGITYSTYFYVQWLKKTWFLRNPKNQNIRKLLLRFLEFLEWKWTRKILFSFSVCMGFSTNSKNKFQNLLLVYLR